MSVRYLAAVSRSSSRIRLASASSSARNTPFHSAFNTPVHSTTVSQEDLRDQDNCQMEPKPQTSRMNMLSSSEVGLGPLGRPASEYSESNSNLSSSDSTPSSDPGMDISSVTGASSPAGDGNDTSSQYSNVCVYRMPIVGYEVLEERSRFTVFKIQIVHQVTGEQWFVFRRYTDFVRLNKKLKLAFPGLRFSLPPKKWFGDNFDPLFLEDRQIGLQAFIDNIIGHAKIRESQAVRKFFCLDYPPGPHDSLEESRAMCQSLEESIAELQEHLKEKDGEISILKSHIHFLSAQQRTLVKALRLECDINEEGTHPPGSTHDLNCALLSICEKSLNGTFGDMGSIASLERELTCEGRRPRSSSDNQITSPVRKILERVFLPSSSQTTSGNTSASVSSMSTVVPSDSNTNNTLQQGSVAAVAPQRNNSLTTMAQQGVTGYYEKTNSSLQEDSSKTSTLQNAQRNGLLRHKVFDGGSTATDIEFLVKDCDTPPCVIIKPGSYSIDITFTAASDSKELKTGITATIGSIDFPWPGPEGCSLLVEGGCPLRKGETYRYFVKMPVLEEYPAIDVFVTWRLTDEFGKDHVCKAFPITIING